MSPPSVLIDAFKAIDEIHAIAVLMVNDGFDADAMRVLAAIPTVSQTWEPPTRALPDDGRPTTAAWLWLLEGWSVDIEDLARSADVTRQTARQKLAVIQKARLAYPDGTMSKGAQGALRAHVAARLIGNAGGKRRKKKTDDEETN